MMVSIQYLFPLALKNGKINDNSASEGSKTTARNYINVEANYGCLQHMSRRQEKQPDDRKLLYCTNYCICQSFSSSDLMFLSLIYKIELFAYICTKSCLNFNMGQSPEVTFLSLQLRAEFWLVFYSGYIEYNTQYGLIDVAKSAQATTDMVSLAPTFSKYFSRLKRPGFLINCTNLPI